MKHLQQLSHSLRKAATVDSATKIEFYADLLTAFEPILEAKEETTTS